MKIPASFVHSIDFQDFCQLQLAISKLLRTEHPLFDFFLLLDFKQLTLTMLCKWTVSGVKLLVSRCEPGRVLRRKTRNFSEFFESYPSTKVVPDGQYLVNAVLAHDIGTVVDILDSGINPNFRAEQVK